MPSKVYVNVERHRMLDGGRVCEDVTKIGLPTLKHSTTTVSAAGMAMDVDMPNNSHLEAAEFTVAHNNGVNCKYLAQPGKHSMEARFVRQRYNVALGEFEYEAIKCRVVGVHVETQKGDIETGNPYGSTEKYSVLHYEEEVNGEITVKVDATTGDIIYNGTSYTDEVESLLN